MSKQHASVSGTVTHIFAHRFVVETGEGAILADLTPPGREKIALQIGDRVTLDGETKPSELKVWRLTCNGKSVEIDHADGKHRADVGPEQARAFARVAGFEPIGEPRRRPKHVEVLARRDGRLFELHIASNGEIRKAKRVSDAEHAQERRPE